MPNEIKPRASLGMTKRKGKRMIPIVQYLIVVVSKATLLKKLHGMSWTNLEILANRPEDDTPN
jgi:hypothetical protein